MIREREAGEITPVSAEQSATRNNNEANNGAGLAIDLDLSTDAYITAGADGTIWLKITLDKVYCVEQVIRHYQDGNPKNVWTCMENDCSDCVGDYCPKVDLTVSTEGAVRDTDMFPASNCRFGDTVKLEKFSEGNLLFAREIAILNLLFAREIVIVGYTGTFH